MTPVLLESMKLLTSIAVSDKADEELKKKASQRLAELFLILDDDISVEKTMMQQHKAQMLGIQM